MATFSNNNDSHLLRNFASTNRNLFPFVSKVVDLRELNSNDDYVFYNALTFHKIQKGTLLVLHGWTRHVKVLARTLDERYYTIPLTYQGTFKVKLRTCNGLEELVACSTVAEDGSDYFNKNIPNNKFKTTKPLDKVRVVDVDKNFTGSQIKIGDIVRVICEKLPSGNRNKAPQIGEIVLDDASEPSKDDSDSLLMFYRRAGRVRLEKMDFESGRAMEIVVPLDLNITFEEVMETINPSKRIWTIGELSNLIQRHPVFVEIVKRSPDHQTFVDDLPVACEIELIQVLAESSLYVSEQVPESPAFHLPIRSEIYLKFHKQLSKKNSPLLVKNSQPLISTLDRCIEHINFDTYTELLQRKLSIDSFLKVSQAGQKSSKMSLSDKHRSDHSNLRVVRRTSIAESDSSSKSSKWSAFSESWRKRFSSSSQNLPRARSFTADTRSQLSTISAKRWSDVNRKDSRSLTRYPTNNDPKKKAKVIYLVSPSRGPPKMYKVPAAPDITLTPPTPPVTIDARRPTINGKRQQSVKGQTLVRREREPVKKSPVVQQSAIATLVVDDDDDNDDVIVANGDVAVVDKNMRNSLTNSFPTQHGSPMDTRSSNLAINNYNKLNQPVQHFTPLLNGQVIMTTDQRQQFPQHSQHQYLQQIQQHPQQFAQYSQQPLQQSQQSLQQFQRHSHQHHHRQYLSDNNTISINNKNYFNNFTYPNSPDSVQQQQHCLQQQTPTFNSSVATNLLQMDFVSAPCDLNNVHSQISSPPDVNFRGSNIQQSVQTQQYQSNSFQQTQMNLPPQLQQQHLHHQSHYSPQQQQQQRQPYDIFVPTFNSNNNNTLIDNFNNLSLSQNNQPVAKSSMKHITVIETYPINKATLLSMPATNLNEANFNPQTFNNSTQYIDQIRPVNNNNNNGDINNKTPDIMNGSNNVNPVNGRTEAKEYREQQSYQAPKISESNYQQSPTLARSKQVHFNENNNNNETGSDSGESSDSWTEQLTIPSDGNLYDFSVEKFCNFLHCLVVPEVVIDKCRRERISGKKFSKMSDGEIESLGLRQPLIFYFRKRTFKRTPKRIKANQNGFLSTDDIKEKTDIVHATSDSGVSSEKNLETSKFQKITL